MNELKTYGFDQEESKPGVAVMADAQSAKAVQEIQAALTIAQKFPRNQSQAFSDIMKSCERPILAEQAIYAYPKGGSVVTGPSIRLAEVLAQNWGNMSTGFRELSGSNGVSEVEAFAWDLQKNVQSTKIFQVPHMRHTRKGSYKLTDPREIYELVANQASRRVRACILAVIPGDVVDAAVAHCKKTQESGQEPIAERVKKLIVAFGEIGVSVELLEKRLGHNMDAVIEAELVTLRAIFKSIKDGMAGREQFFEFDVKQIEQQDGKSIMDSIKSKSKETKKETK